MWQRVCRHCIWRPVWLGIAASSSAYCRSNMVSDEILVFASSLLILSMLPSSRKLMGIPAFGGSPFRKTRVTATRNSLSLKWRKPIRSLVWHQTRQTGPIHQQWLWPTCHHEIHGEFGGSAADSRICLTLSTEVLCWQCPVALVKSMKAKKRLWCCRGIFPVDRRQTSCR